MKTVDVGIMEIDVKTNISKHGYEVQSIEKKIPGNIYEPEMALEDKVYPKTYYRHQLGNVIVDETPTNIKAHELLIVGWTLIEDQQLMKFNMETDAKPQMVKINAQLEIGKVMEVE
jgi:hypothetical protein